MTELMLLNKPGNIQLARRIRDLNYKEDATIDVHFSDDYQQMYFSGELIYLPEDVIAHDDVTILEGELVTLRGEYCVLDRNRPKTVNVHLDSELVTEINVIRDYIALNKSRLQDVNKGEGTQHELLLQMLRRGINEMKDDLGLD